MKNLFFLSCILTILISGCINDNGKTSSYYQAPTAFRFLFRDSLGIGRIDDKNDTLIKISFIHNNEKKYIDDLGVFENPDSIGQYQFSTRNIATVSANNDIEHFKIEFNDGSTGDLYLDVDFVNEGDKSCMCLWPYRAVKYNGIPANKEIEIFGYGVYVFDR